MTFEFRECRMNSIGELCIRVLDMNALRKFLDAYATDHRKDKKYTLEIKRSYPRRSKDANAYLWTLCGLLAEEMSRDGDIVTRDDVYRRHVRECEIEDTFEQITVPRRAAELLQQSWPLNGIAWMVDLVENVGDIVTVRLYYGSRTYNSKQMHQLIDSVVQECEQLGIETMPPEKLASLIDDWRPK